jgi:hypothetical protein
MSSGIFNCSGLFFDLPLFSYGLSWLARGVRQPGPCWVGGLPEAMG